MLGLWGQGQLLRHYGSRSLWLRQDTIEAMNQQGNSSYDAAGETHLVRLDVDALVQAGRQAFTLTSRHNRYYSRTGC